MVCFATLLILHRCFQPSLYWNEMLSECLVVMTQTVLLPATVGSNKAVNKWKSFMMSGLQNDIINCCTFSRVQTAHKVVLHILLHPYLDQVIMGIAIFVRKYV